MRVGQTRVPLDTVVYAFNQGASPEEIVMSYPTLELGDVYAIVIITYITASPLMFIYANAKPRRPGSKTTMRSVSHQQASAHACWPDAGSMRHKRCCVLPQ